MKIKVRRLIVILYTLAFIGKLLGNCRYDRYVNMCNPL